MSDRRQYIPLSVAARVLHEQCEGRSLSALTKELWREFHGGGLGGRQRTPNATIMLDKDDFEEYRGGRRDLSGY